MDQFDAFSIYFVGGSVRIGAQTYPLGQTTTDVLNWDAGELGLLKDRCEIFDVAARTLLKRGEKKLVATVQQKLNDVLDILAKLPPYRDLAIDDTARSLFTSLCEQPEKWDETMQQGSMGQEMFQEFLRKFRELPERLLVFRNQIMLMLEFHFEELPSRNSSAYGKAFGEYFQSMIEGGALFFPDLEFQQSFPAEIAFVPMQNEDGEVVIAEQAQFGELHAFLYVDFYRALARGNAPRRCHNCGRYFLLTRGYNTCYCNNVAPGETTRTCRKVCAHAKEKREREEASPVQQEYKRTYNRLRMQRQRGKKDGTEYNRQMAQAQEIFDGYERGKVGEEDAIARLKAIG